MEAEQGPGIQAGFPQVRTLFCYVITSFMKDWNTYYVQIDLANFAAMAESGPSQDSPAAENWCFTQVIDYSSEPGHPGQLGLQFIWNSS